MTIKVYIISDLSDLFSRFEHFTPYDPGKYIYILIVIYPAYFKKKIAYVGRSIILI